MNNKSKYRIAILTNYPSDLKSFTGGVETATAGLLEGLRNYQDEFEFHIVTLSKGIEKNFTIEHDGFKFHILSVPMSFFLKPHLPYNIIKAYWKIKKINPDLIHCQDNMALAIASILSGYPCIFTIHGIKRMEAKLWRGKEYLSHQLDRILEWFVHRNFHYFIAISPYASNFLNHNKKIIFNISNPVFSEFLISINENRKDYIIYVGPLIYLKQVHILINAFINLKKDFTDLKLIICGSQEDKKYYDGLQKIIKKNNTNGITFIEHLPRKELTEYIRKAFALILPSLQENCPMVIAEAMALGIPVIAARVSGIPYMIEDRKTGLLFNPGDADDLADCIRLLFENYSLRNGIRNEALKVVQELYKPDRVANLTVNVYRILSRK